MIEIFVNECSLHEQLHDKQACKDAFQQFFTVINLLNQQKQAYSLYYHDQLFSVYRLMPSTALITSLNTLPDKSLGVAVRNIFFNKLNAKDWQIEQMHSSDDLFLWGDQFVTDTSMAELAERKLQDVQLLGLLINFPKSKFATLSTVSVTKNELVTSLLDCVDEKATFETWLNEKLQTSLFRYNEVSKDPPTDTQTLLRDKKRFTPTSQFVQGRRIYQEEQSGYYWYVDNEHFGRGAHLEVFDKLRRHVGVADLEGLLDESQAELGRTF
jgi:hypothetical protein